MQENREFILREQIKVVAEARQALSIAVDAKKLLHDEWENQNIELLNDVARKITVTADAEALLRELTLQTYAETGNKAPAVGVGIRVRTILSYLASDALSWAIEHKLALKLDSSTFEKIAKTSNLPFVTISEEPQATIATELVEVDLTHPQSP